MNLIGISINHKTAPIEIREAVHLNNNEIIELIRKLKDNSFSEGVIISTCNRTEIFSAPNNYNLDSDLIIKLLLEIKPIEGLKKEFFNKYFSCSSVKHLFAVSSGIDSLLVGDSQILGQVKEAFDISEDLGFSGTILKRIADNAIRVGKRAIKETSIGEGAVTISYAAVQVVEKIFSNLEKKSALVIGAGETGELAATHLHDKGVGIITITNRTISKAESLAHKINGEILSFDNLKEQIHLFDIIISATSAEDLILSFDDIRTAMKKRKGNPIVIMDIAVPRDIDKDVKKIDNVFYHDMDSLEIIVEQNIQKRKAEIPKVEKIIIEEMVNFFSWYNTLEVVPTIKSIREFFDEIRADELEKIKHKISPEDYIKIEDMTRRMISRLLHNPTVKLRELAETGNNIQDVTANTVILKELFDLDNFKKNGNENGDVDEK